MKKIYFLSSCSTCQGIIAELGLKQKGFEFQDIKTDPISPAQLDALKALAGSYEALFSRRAMKYKEWKLKDRKLTEKDYREYILQEYTFLKRPVVCIGQAIFIGSEKKNLAALAAALGQ